MTKPYFNPEERQLYWRGKALYRGNVLHKLPSNWEEACLYILPSPGIGWGIPEIIAKLPSTSRLLLLESDPELAEFSVHYFCSNLYDYFESCTNTRINSDSMLYGPVVAFLPLLSGYKGSQIDTESMLAYGIQRLYQFLQKNEYLGWKDWCFRRIQVLTLNRAFALQRQIFQPILEWLKSYIFNFWQNRLTLDKLGHLWVRNFFRNVSQLPYNQTSWLPTGNIVLVAAGPSLAQHYHWLQCERNYFHLICVDTALLPLLSAGIWPDYVINLDAQILNLKDFYGVTDMLSQRQQNIAMNQQNHQNVSESLPLIQVADLSCDPRSFSLLPGPFILTATEFAPMQLWQRFGQLQERLTQICPFNIQPIMLEPMGSVGVTSLAIALQNQPKLLLLVGYDFAYPKDLHHVRGTSIHRKLLQESNRLQPANSFSATLQKPLLAENTHTIPDVCTDRLLKSYAQQLQNYLLRHDHNSVIGRLDGLMELSGIPRLNYSQASNALRQNISCSHLSKYTRPRSKQWAKQQIQKQTKQKCVVEIQAFWQEELQILHRLLDHIQNEDLDNSAFWWQKENYAADYLLRLCLPKAGYSESQHCNWPKILQLGQNFMALLTSLISKEN